MEKPPEAADQLKQLARPINPDFPARGRNVWLTQSDGSVMLCRVNTRGGGKWIFRMEDENWKVVDQDSWIVVS
jgi:hypothetical protein